MNNHEQQQQQPQQPQQHAMDPQPQGGISGLVGQILRELLLSNPLPQPPSMMLTDQERQWTLELKQALQDAALQQQQNTEEGEEVCIPFVTDFELAQHAIIAAGNIEEAMERIQGLHHFRQEYRIDHSGNQICFYLQEFMKQQPAYLLHLDYNLETYEGVIIIDAAKFNPAAALSRSTDNIHQDPEFAWKVALIGKYYLHYVVQPSLAATRQGVLTLIECDGVGWHNFDMKFDRRFHDEMFRSFPSKFKACLAYNTSVVANLVISMMKPIMPKSMKQSLHVGCALMDPGSGTPSSVRLGDLYLQPSVQVAQETMIQRAIALTARRLYNETTFRID